MTTMERGVAWGGPAPGLVDVYVRCTDSTWVYDPNAVDPAPPPGAVKVTAVALDYDVFTGYYSRGEQVLLFQEGRRWVALPARNGLATSVPILRDVPPVAAIDLQTWTGSYSSATRTTTPVDRSISYQEYDQVLIRNGTVVGTAPAWYGSYAGGVGGVAQESGSITVRATSWCAVAVITGGTRLARAWTTGISRTESSVPTSGWVVDGTDQGFSSVPVGSLIASFGWGYTAPRDWMDVPPIDFRTLDDDAAFLTGGGDRWGSWPSNYNDVYYVSNGAVWQMDATKQATLTMGTWEWRGSSGYLVPDSSVGITVLIVPPVEHAG